MFGKTALWATVIVFGFFQGRASQPAQQDSGKPAAQSAGTTAASAQNGASAPASGATAVPAADKADAGQTCTLYFYRPRLARGSAVRIGLFVDGTMAVNMVNGRWASIQIPVGHHVIKPKDDQSGIEIEGEAGQNYYFRAGWGEEGMFHGAHKNLMMVMKEQATYEIKQLKPLDDKDLTWQGTKPAETKAADAKH